MINGEGIRGDVSKVASSDPLDAIIPWRAQVPDSGAGVSPAPSRYSSCGESEFEHYCSANSVMGTPSMCSSTITVFNDFAESEIGSLRNFGFGDDNSGLENFSLGGKFERNQLGMDFWDDKKIELRRGNIHGEPSVKYRSSGMEFYDDGEFNLLNEVTRGDIDEMMSWKVENAPEVGSRAEMNNNSDKGGSGEDQVEGFEGERGSNELRRVVNGIRNASSKDVNLKSMEWNGDANNSGFVRKIEEGTSFLPSQLAFDAREENREEDGNSSRYEHWDGEDSIYNYGNDDNHGTDACYQRNAHYDHQELKEKNENPLLINSSVAFGSDDWDDFELENFGHARDSLTMEVLKDKKKQNLKSSFMSLTSSSNTEELQEGKDVRDIRVAQKNVQGDNNLEQKFNSTHNFGKLEQSAELEVRDIPAAICQVQAVAELTKLAKSTFVTKTSSLDVVELNKEDAEDILVNKHQVQASDELGYVKNCSLDNGLMMELHKMSEKAPLKMGLGIEEAVGVDDSQVFENQGLGNSKLKPDPLSDVIINQGYSYSTDSPGNTENFCEDHGSKPPHSTSESILKKVSSVSADLADDHSAAVKGLENLELNELYNEVVHEMEEILLDSGESPATRFSHGNKMFKSQLSLPLRDGGSTASASGTDYASPHNTQQQLRIDGVEVIGARQNRGDVSFSERLVGVKEYTVYKIRVWSGTDQWEVERRYRDFYSLYRQLKMLFADKDWTLPSPWSSVEKESRKIFGNASPNVIAERTAIIQECLRSILHSRCFLTPPSALFWFLFPQESSLNFPSSSMLVGNLSFFSRGEDTQNYSILGKTVSLIVEIRPHKSMKQILEGQHYTCAGCHRYFGDGKTLIQEFVQTLGWGKPRLCEYTGQLFCFSCHTNDTAVLLARVLYHWDFTRYPVSHLAKSYLDSIHDQPMLYVSAVNPFLFSKVPALLQVMGVRKKIGTVLPYVRCPFRKSVNKGLGPRKYLLESNDFFALRDLIDLSKGAFAALPVMVETVLRKISEHITEQCLICCDVGIPCCARQFCSDPSFLIFPFQEDEIERCKSCQSVFHKLCFRKLTRCPCGEYLRVADETVGLIRRLTRGAGAEVTGAFDLLGRPVEFISGVFTKSKLEKVKTATVIMSS